MEQLHYSMIIDWSDEDNTYIVTIPDLPGCKTHGDTYEEALQQGKDSIETWLEVSKRLGRSIPQPRQYAA
jgi:predicted RNase H-like HicB family nuclease